MIQRQVTSDKRQLSHQRSEFLLLAVVCSLVLTGCVRRALTIRSEPPGAQLFVNDTLLGRTPYTYDFEWYGWYRISLTKPGYQRMDDHPLIKAPFYLWIPFDLVMELLPWRIRDERTLSYTLAPKPKLPEPQAPALDIPDVPQATTPATPSTGATDGATTR